jgi:hypothetical protein
MMLLQGLIDGVIENSETRDLKLDVSMPSGKSDD